MMAIVTPQDRERFFEIIDKWDVEAAVIGHLTGDGRLTIDHYGHRIVDVDPKTVAHEGPVYDRPYARPAWQDELQAATSEDLARPATREELIADVRAVLSDVNQASKAWVTDQYDRYVQGNTALAQQIQTMNDHHYTGYLVQEVADEHYFSDPYAADRRNLRVLERFVEDD